MDNENNEAQKGLEKTNRQIWTNIDKIERKHFCDHDCNNCEALENRQIAFILNILREIYGEGVYHIVQHFCPNFTCCPDCRIDDFCHFENCEIIDTAEKVVDNLLKESENG